LRFNAEGRLERDIFKFLKAGGRDWIREEVKVKRFPSGLVGHCFNREGF